MSAPGNPTHVGRLLLCAVLLLAAACNVKKVDIKGHAMSPTLEDGDSAIAVRVSGPLQRGDVVGFRYPVDQSKSFVKRIIGLPGETIAVTAGRVSINGQMIDEPYVLEANRSSETTRPIVIPAGEYFVMGDNRVNSSDSRSWGFVPAALIWAKVMVR